MGIVTKLIKAALSAVLVNKATRDTALAALVKSMRYIFRSGSVSKTASSGTGRRATVGGSGLLSTLLLGAAELLILKLARKSSFSGAAVLSALAAIFLAARRGGKVAPSSAEKSERGRIIDFDEYTVLDEKH
jgi:hypothetical protein